MGGGVHNRLAIEAPYCGTVNRQPINLRLTERVGRNTDIPPRTDEIFRNRETLSAAHFFVLLLVSKTSGKRTRARFLSTLRDTVSPPYRLRHDEVRATQRVRN